ncbi:unnamed protein product [Rotaria sp. Silwood1]|nr:unnamed protein product [Rotaria sp. Silwood1]CAF1680841.1 unnamed protein product [Rotaria sp. Silwood1]
MQTRSILDTSSNNLFTNIERLGTHDLLSYGQFSHDTILTLIRSNNTLPLSANGFVLTLSLQILIEIYVI